MVRMEPSEFHAVKAAALRDVADTYGIKEAGVLRTLFADKEWKSPGKGAWNTFKAYAGLPIDMFRMSTLGSPISLGEELHKNFQKARAKDSSSWLGSAASSVGQQIKNFYYKGPERDQYLQRRLQALRGRVGTLHNLQGRDKEVLQKIMAARRGDTIGRGMSNAMTLGLPAMDLYGAATQSDPEVRKGDLASGVAGLVVAPFTSRLGLIGNVLQSGAQQGARKLVGVEPPPDYKPHFNPIRHARLVARGALAANNADFQFPADVGTY